MADRTFARAPTIGEFIHGREYPTGGVECIIEQVTDDGFDHWIVVEDFYHRKIRVKREPNGVLYECEIVPGYFYGD